MKTVIRFSIAALFLAVSLPVAWILTASRAAEIPQGVEQSERATTGELSQLLKARFDSAVALLDFAEKQYTDRKAPAVDVRDAALRVRDSALEMAGDPAEHLAALTKYLTIARRIEELMKQRVLVGLAHSSEAELGRYLRLDAEVALVRAKLQGGTSH